MTCRAATGFAFHSPRFALPAPSGFARCIRCDQLVDLERFMREPCPGTNAERSPHDRHASPPSPGSIACALCGESLVVDPLHRETVARFGSTCNACAGLVESIGAEPVSPHEVNP